MQLYLRFLVMLGISLFTSGFFTGCNKGEDPAPGFDFVETSDVNDLQQLISIPDGKLISGDFPKPSFIVSNVIRISGYQSSISTVAGYQLPIPIQFTDTSVFTKPAKWKFAYLQIIGATNGYYKVENTKSDSGNFIILPVNLPSKIYRGSFKVNVAVEDENGNVTDSRTIEISIREPLKCGNASLTGSEGLSFTQVEMGDKSGVDTLTYDAYNLMDRIDIIQGTEWIAGTGGIPQYPFPPLCHCDNDLFLGLSGFVSQSNKIIFPYDASKGKTITVIVNGCIAKGGTSWSWKLSCL